MYKGIPTTDRITLIMLPSISKLIGPSESVIKFKKRNIALNQKTIKPIMSNILIFSDEKSWTANGAALQMLGQYEEAYKCYEKALEIKAKYEPAYKNKNHIISLSKK